MRSASASSPAIECVEVDHDPATHQLRVLGCEAFDTLRLAADGGHYEVVLRSRT